MLFPSVHKGGAVGVKPVTGRAVNELIERRVDQTRVHPRRPDAAAGGTFTAIGFRHRDLPGPARKRTPSCGKPGTVPEHPSAMLTL